MECIRSGHHRRLLSCMVYSLCAFLYGFDFLIRLPQLVFYLKELETKNVPLFEGIIFVASDASASFSGFLFGHLCDSYGNARRWITLCCLCNFIGTLMYSSPISVWTMLVGRVVAGVYFRGVLAIMTAEMARMFPGKQITRALALVNLGLAIGLLVGPPCNIFLVDVNFNWGWFYIHPTNAPGFVTCCLAILVQLPSLCFLYNSDEIADHPTFKGQSTAQKQSEKDPEKISTIQLSSIQVMDPSLPQVRLNMKAQMRLLLSSKDLLLLYCCTFSFSFTVMSLEAIIPLVSTDWLGFSATKLSIVYVASGGTFVFVNILLALCQKFTNDFHWMLAMATLQLSIPAMLLCIYNWKDSNTSVTALYYIWVIVGSMTWILEDVLTRAISTKFVPLEMQGFSEALRSVPRAVGVLFAGFMVSVWFNHVVYVSTVDIALILIVVVLLLWRRKHLSAPTRLSLPRVPVHVAVESPVCKDNAASEA